MQHQFHKDNEKKYSSNRNGYISHQKLKSLNNKIRNLSDHLKDINGITVITDHPQCAEPPDTMVKFENCNRIPIQNCTSVYQIKICTARSALIIGRISFISIKGSIYSDTIDYLLCHQCAVHLSDEDTDKEKGIQFIYIYFIGVLYDAKTSAIIILWVYLEIFSPGMKWMVVW